MAGFTTEPPMAQTVVMGSAKRGWPVVAMLAAGTLWGAPGPAVCTGSAYGALNFWVGGWKVADPAGNELGSSKIEPGLDGCELIETWASGNFGGRNVHAYSSEDHHWHQLNVDNHGHVHAFEGAANEAGLEYSGVSKNGTGGDVLNRMDIVKQSASRVRVWWRKSADSGKTWSTAYEAIYSRIDNTNKEGIMLGTSKIVAFAAIRDRDAARKFYRDTLGLRLVGEDQFALVFDANGTTLRLAPVPDWTPPQFTVLGWEVKDIAGAVKALRSAGVEFQRYPWMKDQDDQGIWTSPSGEGVAAVHAGARVAWFKDPDGNVLSVSQMPE